MQQSCLIARHDATWRQTCLCCNMLLASRFTVQNLEQWFSNRGRLHVVLVVLEGVHAFFKYYIQIPLLAIEIQLCVATSSEY